MAKKKIDFKWNVLFESLKEPLRLLVLAIISWVITSLVPQLDEAWVPVFVVALKWLDKFVYEYKSEKGTEGAYKGLVGF